MWRLTAHPRARPPLQGALKSRSPLLLCCWRVRFSRVIFCRPKCDMSVSQKKLRLTLHTDCERAVTFQNYMFVFRRSFSNLHCRTSSAPFAADDFVFTVPMQSSRDQHSTAIFSEFPPYRYDAKVLNFLRPSPPWAVNRCRFLWLDFVAFRRARCVVLICSRRRKALTASSVIAAARAGYPWSLEALSASCICDHARACHMTKRSSLHVSLNTSNLASA